jgi:hypothetical protein
MIVLLDGETGDVGLIRQACGIPTPTYPPCQAYLPHLPHAIVLFAQRPTSRRLRMLGPLCAA